MTHLQRTPEEFGFLAESKLRHTLSLILASVDTIASVAKDLASFAQTGKPEGVSPELLEAFVCIVGPYCSAPGDPVALMAEAALGRMKINRGLPVSAQQVAALAGLSLISVRKATERGSLVAASRGHVTADSAATWLRKRGLPGFPRAKFLTRVAS